MEKFGSMEDFEDKDESSYTPIDVAFYKEMEVKVKEKIANKEEISKEDLNYLTAIDASLVMIQEIKDPRWKAVLKKYPHEHKAYFDEKYEIFGNNHPMFYRMVYRGEFENSENLETLKYIDNILERKNDKKIKKKEAIEEFRESQFEKYLYPKMKELEDQRKLKEKVTGVKTKKLPNAPILSQMLQDSQTTSAPNTAAKKKKPAQ